MFDNPVSEIMTRSVLCVHMNERIDKAIHLFLENHISILPVVNTAGCCVGVVTLKDVVASEKVQIDRRDAQLKSVTELPVGDVMSADFVWIGEDESIAASVKKTLEKSIHHLLVLDENRCLVGVVSSVDILKQLHESKLENSI